MPSQAINLSNFKGLYVQANSFSAVPDGAFEVAENVVFTQDGVLNKRRGFFSFLSPLTAPLSLYQYRGDLVLNYNAKLASISSIGTISDHGTCNNAVIYPRYSEGSGKLFITSDDYIQILESLTSNVRPAGLAPALDLSVSITGKSGVIPPDSQVGYRICFVYDDSQGNRLLSAPSSYASVTNLMNTGKAYSYATGTVTVTHTGHGLAVGAVTLVIKTASSSNINGTFTNATVVDANTITYVPGAVASPTTGTLDYGVYQTPTLTFSLPDTLTAVAKYQIYRTDATTLSSLESEEYTLKLASEVQITSTDITNKYVTTTDVVADIFRGAYLYTNPDTGLGAANANFQPPKCQDLALFKGSMFYANTEEKHSLYSNMVSAALLSVNDTVTIGGYVYTAKSAENIANREFKIDTSSSPALAIALTAQSLCRCINRYTLSPVVAYYLSGPDDVPGKLGFIAENYGTSFTFASSKAGVFLPEATTAQPSTATARPNQIQWSKQDQPEHVPGYAYMQIGSKDEAILRIVALKDSLIVIKAASVWRVNGDAMNFTALLLDNTVSCRAPDSVRLLNNAVWMVSNQGIVQISDSSVQVMSRVIEPLLTSISGVQAFYDVTTAVAYESDRSYLLSTITESSDTQANVVYCYNIVSNTFSTWTTPFQSAVCLSTDDKLYLLGDDEIYKERKNQNKLDYCEQSYSLLCGNKISDNSIELKNIFNPIAVGDVIAFNDVINRVVKVETVLSEDIVTFNLPINFDSGETVGHYKYIRSNFRTSPLTLGSVSTIKRFAECSLSFRQDSVSILTSKFLTDSVSGSSEVIWLNPIQIGWGLEQWGTFQWGDSQGIKTSYITIPNRNLRTYVPIEAQRATYIQLEAVHTVAAESMNIQNIGFKVLPLGGRIQR